MRKGEIYSRLATAAADSGDDEAQRKLQQAAAKWLGKARGGDPSRSERVRENLRARLKKQRAPDGLFGVIKAAGTPVLNTSRRSSS